MDYDICIRLSDPAWSISIFNIFLLTHPDRKEGIALLLLCMRMWGKNSRLEAGPIEAMIGRVHVV